VFGGGPALGVPESNFRSEIIFPRLSEDKFPMAPRLSSRSRNVALAAAMIAVTAGVAVGLYFMFRSEASRPPPTEVGVIVYGDTEACGEDVVTLPDGSVVCGATITVDFVNAPAFPLQGSYGNVFVRADRVFKISIYNTLSAQMDPQAVFRTDELTMETQGWGMFSACHRFDIGPDNTFMRVETVS
jgi:hypothetical protein